MPHAGSNGGRVAETEARKERILAAAIELARSGGYDAVQMRDVAATAHVALGTLYRHYPSKDHLLIAALEREARELQARFVRRPPSGGNAAERVADVLRRASRALERDPEVTAALVTALASTDASGDRNVVADQLHAIIGRAIDEEPTSHLDDLVRILGYVWWAVLNAWVGSRAEISMGDELATAAFLLLDGRTTATHQGTLTS